MTPAVWQHIDAASRESKISLSLHSFWGMLYVEDAIASREQSICSLWNMRRTAITSSVQIRCCWRSLAQYTVCMACWGLRAAFICVVVQVRNDPRPPPTEYIVQTPRFLGSDYICAINTYNRGMAQDIIFDRVNLAQPHEYSWPAAPYHANIRKSTQHGKMEPCCCCCCFLHINRSGLNHTQ